MSSSRTRYASVSAHTTLMTRQQLCDWWGVNTSCVSTWIQLGLPEIKLSEKLRFYDVNDVEEFIRTYAKNKAKEQIS